MPKPETKNMRHRWHRKSGSTWVRCLRRGCKAKFKGSTPGERFDPRARARLNRKGCRTKVVVKR